MTISLSCAVLFSWSFCLSDQLALFWERTTKQNEEDAIKIGELFKDKIKPNHVQHHI